MKKEDLETLIFNRSQEFNFTILTEDSEIEEDWEYDFNTLDFSGTFLLMRFEPALNAMVLIKSLNFRKPLNKEWADVLLQVREFTNRVHGYLLDI